MLERGKKVSEYVLLEKLGAGGFGEVWRGEKRTELSISYFALKFFRPLDDEEIDIESVKREIQTWQNLSGLPNIISVVEANRFEDYVYIVSEFAEGGSLDKWLKANGGRARTLEEAVAITRQILKGLEGMHAEGFVHRDLKPANVLLKKGTFYLADFGISREMKTHSKTNSTAGTYEYMPPEAFEQNPSVSAHTDLWAAGAILQKLLTGTLPFPQKDIPSLLMAILMNEPAPLPESVPLSLREIVRKALQKDRAKRFQTAREMRAALKDPPGFLAYQQALDNPTAPTRQAPPTGNYEPPPTVNWQQIEAEKERQRRFEEARRQTLEQQERETEAPPEFKRLRDVGSQNDEDERFRSQESREVLTQQRNLGGVTDFSRPPKRKLLNVVSLIVGVMVLIIFLIFTATFIYSFLRVISNNGEGNVNNSNGFAFDKNSNSNKSSNLSSISKNSLGMEFVKIPSGSFMMGSSADEKEGQADERPQHRVTITRDFYLSKYEVTVGQWRAVMNENPSPFTYCGENCPVVNVSWEEVQKYIKELNKKGEGTYRLPTESEWEYAARAGTTGRYIDSNIDDFAWHQGNSGGKIHPVGQKKANAFGLYDMPGSVWEWMSDWYAPYSSESVTNPQGPSSGSSHVERGGSWNGEQKFLGSAYRGLMSPTERHDFLGFRLVRE